MKCKPFAVDPDTLEVFERVPKKEWSAKLSAWIACRTARKASYHAAFLPSPMPHGHVMFRCTKGNRYRPVDAPPIPVWSDGIGALFAGQRIGWEEETKRVGWNESRWHYGVVSGIDPDSTANILVTTNEYGTISLDPYSLA